MNGLEIRHLRTLRALRETGKVADAADRVCLTQSAVSHQLKDLEERFGCVLVHRQSQPYQFTAAGKRLLDLADVVLPQIYQATSEITRIAGGNSGRLHIAIECHSCFDWLLPTLDLYQQAWPDVEVDIAGGFHFQPMAALAEGKLDLVVTSDPIRESRFTYVPLFHYEAKLAMSNEHPLTKMPYIEPEQLLKETVVTYPIEQSRLDIFKYFLHPASVQPNKVRTAELTSVMIHLVAAGRCVTGLPTWVLFEYEQKDIVCSKPLGKDGVWATLYAGVRKDFDKLPLVQGFCDTTTQACFETLQGIRRVR